MDVIGAAPSRRRKRDDDCTELTLADISRARKREVMPIHLLFECATGYALFLARGITQVGIYKFQSVEEYLNQSDQPFELESYLPFSSHQDALIQMNAISKSLVTDQLQKFLEDFLPQPKTGGSIYSVGVSSSMLGARILRKTGLGVRSAILIQDVMRGLRMKIDELIGLGPGELKKAQLNLARLYNNQACTQKVIKSPVVVSSSSFSLQEQVGVVPHRFEGVFKAKGKENMLCTKYLVPREALYCEELIRVYNEDRTEVEYRVWDPLRSKLGAAIMCGVTNIWIVSSCVLYVGYVCGLTVSNLSDLVGSDGMVYVVGYFDDVVGMAGKRPNVVTIIEKCWNHGNYRMLVGMVDVIFGEIDRVPEQLHILEGNFIFNNAHFYLRAGGHYMICTRVNDIHSVGQVKDLFRARDHRKEFKPIETVMLDLMEGAYALVVGGYRMLEE